MHSSADRRCRRSRHTVVRRKHDEPIAGRCAGINLSVEADGGGDVHAAKVTRGLQATAQMDGDSVCGVLDRVSVGRGSWEVRLWAADAPARRSASWERSRGRGARSYCWCPRPRTRRTSSSSSSSVPTRSPDAFRRRLKRRTGTGTAPSPGGVTHWAAVQSER